MIINIPNVPVITKLIVAIVICVVVSTMSNVVVSVIDIINPIIDRIIDLLYSINSCNRYVIKINIILIDLQSIVVKIDFVEAL